MHNFQKKNESKASIILIHELRHYSSCLFFWGPVLKQRKISTRQDPSRNYSSRINNLQTNPSSRRDSCVHEANRIVSCSSEAPTSGCPKMKNYTIRPNNHSSTKTSASNVSSYRTVWESCAGIILKKLMTSKGWLRGIQESSRKTVRLLDLPGILNQKQIMVKISRGYWRVTNIIWK